MAKRDYYDLLGVGRRASGKEIKQAFRRLARKHHPDVNPGDGKAEARFKEINEAYEVLSDKDNRKKYDQFGENWKHGDRFSAAGAAGDGPQFWRWDRRGAQAETGFDGFDFFAGGGVEDLFRRAGGRSGRGVSRKGQDIEHPVEVTLEEAYHGSTRVLSMTDPSGKPRRLEVKIPAGVNTGSRVRMKGEGGLGAGGGPSGDLWLVITVLPHARFERQGEDLYVDAPVTLVDAVLGAEVEVPTLRGGNLALKIPPETQNDRAFRLTGQGMPKLNGASKGDLYARVKVVLPTDLTEHEKELFKELKAIRDAGVTSHG